MPRQHCASISELASHARGLARAYNLTLREHDNGYETTGKDGQFVSPAYAIPPRTILAPRVVDEVAYVCVMHEMGHLVAPAGLVGGNIDRLDPRNHTIVLTEEHAAWEWARAMALDWTPTMEHVAVQALQSYEQNTKIAEAYSTLYDLIGMPKTSQTPSPQPTPPPTLRPESQMRTTYDWRRRSRRRSLKDIL